MKTNSSQQSGEITPRGDARNYWFAILDAMTTIMEIEKRNESVKSWGKYDDEQKRLTIYFDENKTDETMTSQICKYAGIDRQDIKIDNDEKRGKSLTICGGNYNEETLQVAESVANLYGFCVPKRGRKYNQLGMKRFKFMCEAINTALQNDYEEESVFLNGNEIGKCIIRNIGKCIVELGEKAIKSWNDKKLIENGMSVRFENGKKTAQIDCFRLSLNRLFGVNNAPSPENYRLPEFLFNTALARKIEMWKEIVTNDEKMNDDQKKAVAKALMTEDMSIIQGPAGTGKTTVITEIVKRLLAGNPCSRILIVSQTNVAVDNALERLAKIESIHPLRIGRPMKIKKEIRKYCYQLINDWVKDKTSETCAAENYCKMDENEDALHFRARCRSKFMKDINVFGATCCSSGMGSMRNAYNEVFGKPGEKQQPCFDFVIIDEASKATLLDMTIPMVMSKKIILIGDHKQLPPYCDKDKSRMMLGLVRKTSLTDYMYDAKNRKMRPSQFERMITTAKECNDSIVTTLHTQYRMHKQIMNLLEPFYKEEGGLKCGVSDSERQHELHYANWLSKDDHAIFLNINGKEERKHTSYVNDIEEEAIRKVVKAMQLSAIVDGREKLEIGIISFYKPQAKKLENIEGLTSATVDKFQGAEKDVIILSTVRSKELGFIDDSRRLNVALSRAKNLLIVVGNKEMLQNNEDYRFVIDHMKTINYADIERRLP
ncbi:MAG: AAA domain-containing protein [Paludibacteraceae bacterium]|nr:AAA domain-containing protein [Paludibacteraceae bacterium]